MVGRVSGGSMALGLMLLSVGKETIGSSVEIILASLMLPTAVAIAGLVLRMAARPSPGERGAVS